MLILVGVLVFLFLAALVVLVVRGSARVPENEPMRRRHGRARGYEGAGWFAAWGDGGWGDGGGGGGGDGGGGGGGGG